MLTSHSGGTWFVAHRELRWFPSNVILGEPPGVCVWELVS